MFLSAKSQNPFPSRIPNLGPIPQMGTDPRDVMETWYDTNV